MAVLQFDPVEQKLRELGGNMAAVARAFGVTRAAVHAFVHRHPDLVAAVHDCRESMKDEAEDALYGAVRNGQPWAVCFYLKTQAKDRGYVERSEVSLLQKLAEDIRGMSDEQLLALCGDPGDAAEAGEGGGGEAGAG